MIPVHHTAPCWTVVYDDPKRTGKSKLASHTLHAPDCADVARAADRGANTVQIEADTLDQALLIAQYQEADHIGDAGWDLGAVDAAPCTR